LGIYGSDEGPGEASAEVLLRHPKVRWEGWGCSLAWCGKALGGCAQADAWADLLFTTRDFDVGRLWRGLSAAAPRRVPGLGLSVVRYNVGGTGHAEEERRSFRSRGWYAEIEGFQPGPASGFDWERDVAQRRFLSLAVERGVDAVELFANAPMWWMTDSKSSFGGNLALPDAFANYLAEVAAHAQSSWHLPVKSVSPLNEPSAGWWRYPHDQEGCNVPAAEQAPLLVKLRGELDRRGLQDVLIAASDENTPAAALSTWTELRSGAAKGCVGRLNVHAYDGLKPWREAGHPGVRGRLQRCARSDGLPVWMSEHGGGEVDGLGLAQTILEDLCYLRPTAWCYWQLVEHQCSWGFVEARFGQEDTVATALPHPKHYVFAHFSHFLRPGFEMLQCAEPWAAAGFFEPEACLACVLLNSFTATCRLQLRLPGFAAPQGRLEAVFTEPQQGSLLAGGAAEALEEDGCLVVRVEMPPLAVCSLRVPDSQRARSSRAGAGALPPGGLAASQARALARAAAHATAAERLYGEGDARVVLAWQQVDHACGCAEAALEAVIPCKKRREQEVEQLKCLTLSAAWGAANERKYGSHNADAKSNFNSFHAMRKSYLLDENVNWMIFNTCWAVVNKEFLGSGNSHTTSAAERAESHFATLGPSACVLPRRAWRTPAEVPSYPRWTALVRHAQAGHNVDEKLLQRPDNPLTEAGREQAVAARSGPAGDAVRSADVLLTSPLRRAVETARLLMGGREAPLRVVVEVLATERYSAPCDDGVPKAETLAQLPADVTTWEGWEGLPECWWPGPEDNPERRAGEFREALRACSGDRVVAVGHGGFWQQLVGCYLENCDVIYCHRDLC